MRDDTKTTWWPHYRALLAGRQEEDLDLAETQTLVKDAKEADRVAQHEAERVELEEAHAKFHSPNWHKEMTDYGADPAA